MRDCTLVRRQPSAVVAIGVLLALSTPPAGAAEPGTLDEVVVTAQKRAESIQDVPIAITALSQASMRALEMRGAEDLQRAVPNLTWTPAGGAGFSVGMRGVVDNIYTTNQVGSVAVVVDDVGLNSPVVNNFALFDLERVEVLRGPQVTLYGRSTTGGAVSFVTHRPRVEDGVNGTVIVTAGRFDERNVEAAVGVPLGARTALRLAATTQNRDGIYSNPTLGTRDGDRERHVGRLSLASHATETLDIFTSAHYGVNRGESLRYKSAGLYDPTSGGPCRTIHNSDPGNGCVDGAGFGDSPDFSVNTSNFPQPREDIDAYGGTLQATWTLGAVALTSITAYDRNSLLRSEDSDGAAGSIVDVHIDADTRQVSQELRLASTASDAPLRWIAGAFYLDEHQDGITASAIRLPTVDGPPPQFRSLRYRQDDTIKSGYGQIDARLASAWTLTVGARYSSERKAGEAATLRAPGPLALARLPPVGVPITREIAAQIADPTQSSSVATPFGKTWDNWGGKVGLNWSPNDDTLVYGSVTRGFKGGTFNFAAAVRLPFPAQAANFQAGVDPEKLTTFEVGAKWQLLARTLRLNTAVFRSDYRDQQVFTFKDGGPVLVNAASSTITGIEAELEWIPADGWLITSGAGYLDGTYDEFIDTDGTDYSGNRIIQTPKFNWNGLVRYSFDTAGRWSIQGAFKHFTDQYFGVDNAPVTRIDAQTLLDARLAYAFGAESRYELALWGKNLSDERYCTYTGVLPWGQAQCVASEPRTYGVTLTGHF